MKYNLEYLKIDWHHSRPHRATPHRLCEKRSDEAIQEAKQPSGLLPASLTLAVAMTPTLKALIITIAAFLVLSAAPASAQTKGKTTIQGRDAGGDAGPASGGGDNILDYREQMRKFVQNISNYARSLRPAFVVIPQNGPELLVKQDVADPEKASPAYAYMHSIDGVLQEALFFGMGAPVNKDKQTALLALTDQAKENGLKVLVVDYAGKAETADQSYSLNSAKGYIPFAAHQRIEDINSLPPYPKRPVNENPTSILSLRDAMNFLVIGDSSAFGRVDEFAMKIHDTNYDVVITDIFHGRAPLSKKAVETLKFKKVGGRRLVLAHVDIGSAASYRYYWKPHWREGSPLWINAPHRDDPDNYYVQYWQPEWQKVITGDAQSLISGIVTQGFDGVVLGGVDAYLFFEGAINAEEEGQ